MPAKKKAKKKLKQFTLPEWDDVGTIVGIDNGLEGHLFAICAKFGEIICEMPMPTVKRPPAVNKGAAKVRGEVDPDGLKAFMARVFEHTSDECQVLVGIEEPPAHAPSAAAMRSLSVNYGLMFSLFNELPRTVAAPVDVGDWHKILLGKFKKGTSKQEAFRVAEEMHSGFKEQYGTGAGCEIPGPHFGKKKAMDGAADAFLIAHYLRIRLAQQAGKIS